MENKQEIKIDQKFIFNDRNKTLSVVTTNESEDCTKNYTDNFNEEQIVKLHKGMKNDKNLMETNIQAIEKQISELSDTINKSKIKLSKEQKDLMKNLKVLQEYKPIEDAKTRKVQSEDTLKGLIEQLVSKKKIINEIETKCKGLKFG